MSRRPLVIFALGTITGALGLIALTWAYVAYDAWTADRQKVVDPGGLPV